MRKVVYVCLLSLICGCQTMPCFKKEDDKAKEVETKVQKTFVEKKVQK